MSATIHLDKNSILAQLASLADVAKKNKWEVDYDETIDTYVFGQKVIPDDSFLLSVDDDISLYVDKNSKLNGLMIEYFNANYITHHKDLQPIANVVTGSGRAKKAEVILAEKALQYDILQDSISSLLKVKDLATVI